MLPYIAAPWILWGGIHNKPSPVVAAHFKDPGTLPLKNPWHVASPRSQRALPPLRPWKGLEK